MLSLCRFIHIFCSLDAFNLHLLNLSCSADSNYLHGSIIMYCIKRQVDSGCLWFQNQPPFYIKQVKKKKLGCIILLFRINTKKIVSLGSFINYGVHIAAGCSSAKCIKMYSSPLPLKSCKTNVAHSIRT